MSSTSRRSAPVTCGPSRLDPSAYQATLDAAPLELTRTEFGLLHLPLRDPGRAFSRSYLPDTVWGENYVAGDRSVDNAILHLRKKIGALGDAIETAWDSRQCSGVRITTGGSVGAEAAAVSHSTRN